MEREPNHFAEAAMLIRKPINIVYQSFVDPETTTKFWFTKSSGHLSKGESVVWTWKMFNLDVKVNVIEMIKDEKIIIQWGEDPEAIVEWQFNKLGEEKTFVTITNTGFKGSPEELISQIRDSTGGFTWVLAGLKAYLEHGIKLNLIQDRYPPELR